MTLNGDKSPGMGETYYIQVSESIRDIFELATRIDERVQSLSKKVDNLELKIEVAHQDINDIKTRISIVENNIAPLGKKQMEDIKEITDRLHATDMKLQELGSESERQGGRWKTVFNFTIQTAIALLTGYLLWKLGLLK